MSAKDRAALAGLVAEYGPITRLPVERRRRGPRRTSRGRRDHADRQLALEDRMVGAIDRKREKPGLARAFNRPPAWQHWRSHACRSCGGTGLIRGGSPAIPMPCPRCAAGAQP
jgi:hypothetical protein